MSTRVQKQQKKIISSIRTSTIADGQHRRTADDERRWVTEIDDIETDVQLMDRLTEIAGD